jgi:glycosyltransferase involved in cell wall biosynthesis
MEIMVSVLMPVYNAEKYLAEAIESILKQTYNKFEFIIINDGSTDSSEEIIKSYSDSRIRYIKNEKNVRLVATLNKGIDLIRTRYLVRMDADDLSLPGRIEELVNYMENNPGVGVCGSSMEVFGDENGVQNFPETDEEIKVTMLFESCIPHPAAIIRMSVLNENQTRYDERFIHMEDYYLWHRLRNSTQFHNLKKVLYKYRISGNNITLKNKATYRERLRVFMQFQLDDYGLTATEAEIENHLAFTAKAFICPKCSPFTLFEWRKKLEKINKEKMIFNQKIIDNQLKKRWERLFYKLIDQKKGNCFGYWRTSRVFKFHQLRYIFGQILRTRRRINK